MAGNYIRLTEVLDLMDALDSNGDPIPFSIRFVTANRKDKTGGEIITIDKAVKCVGKDKKGNPVIDTRRKETPDLTKPKNPNHWSNATRNLFLPNGQIRKVHIRLIIEFNGQKVCY